MRVLQASREWPAVPGGTGRQHRPCGPGAGRAPWSPRPRGLDPVTASGQGPPGPGPETGTELACVHTSLPNLSRPRRPGGWEASPVAHRRAQQAGRSLLSKTPGWSRRRPASLCPRGPGWRKSPSARAASPEAGPHFQLQSLNCPKQGAQRSVKLYKNLNASVVEAGVGRSRGLAAGDELELGVRLGAQKSVAQFSHPQTRYPARAAKVL